MNTPNYLFATSLLMVAAATSPISSDTRFAHNQVGTANLDTDTFPTQSSISKHFIAHELSPREDDQAQERHAHHDHHRDVAG